MERHWKGRGKAAQRQRKGSFDLAEHHGQQEPPLVPAEELHRGHAAPLGGRALLSIVLSRGPGGAEGTGGVGAIRSATQQSQRRWSESL